LSTDATLDVLDRWGDTLERAICQDRLRDSEEANYLTLVLYPYSGIWYDHILPRRDRFDLGKIDNRYTDWVPFAASHYTALIKFYQAFRKHHQLIHSCNQASGGLLNAEILFEAHDAIAGFWEHMGSAIDNLGRCFDDIPGKRFEKGGGLKLIQSGYEKLDFTFKRRTQMIHHSLVPIGFDDGAIVFNERSFDELETNWTTTRWTPEWIDKYHIQHWKAMVGELNRVWSRLRNDLKRADLNPPSVPDAVKNPKKRIQDGNEVLSGSGVPSVKQSNSTRNSSGSKTSEPYWVRADYPRPSG
jgi:hypothetical protein